MALTTTYRPKLFEDVVGQQHIVDVLLAQTKQQQFSSSYLLYGPRGTGKTTTARLLAKVVNCTTFTADGMPDLRNDPQAQLIDSWKTLDFVEIDAASHTGVDNIREEIIDKALYPPTALKTKVYVIDEVHMLSKGAFNALLKIMEEPREYLMFVLATTEIHKVPDTIISRCQVFNFKQIPPQAIADRLGYIAQHENIQFEQEALMLIARVAQGALRDAIKYLEQVSVLWPVTQQHVAQFLWIVPEQKIHEFVQLLEQRSLEKSMKFLDELVGEGADFVQLTKEVLLFLDAHFLEKPDLYAPLAGMIEEIAASVKRYPHPVLVRKRKIRKRCEESVWSVSQQWKTTTVSSPSAEAVTADIPAAAPLFWAWASVVPQSPLSQDSASVALDEHNMKHAWQRSERDFTQLMNEIADRIDNVMLKSVLKKQAVIDSLEDDLVSITIINEQYYHSVQKPEIVSQLQEIASSLLWFSVHIKRRYMSKEAFMNQQMGTV